MRCPTCGLINPDSAMRCDCGHRFPVKAEVGENDSCASGHIDYPPSKSAEQFDSAVAHPSSHDQEAFDFNTFNRHQRSGPDKCASCGKRYPSTEILYKRILKSETIGSYNIGIEEGSWEKITYDMVRLPACHTCAFFWKLRGVLSSEILFVAICAVIGLGVAIHGLLA